MQTLDSYGECFHDYSGTGKFYMYFEAIDPTSKTIKVATKSNIVYHYSSSCSSPDYVVYDNLQIEGAINSGFSIGNNSTYNIIKNCSISFCGENGVNIRYSVNYTTIDNNVFSDCTSAAIYSRVE